MKYQLVCVQVESLQFELYRAERRKVLLESRLSQLQQTSCWPYRVTETSDRVFIRKLSHDSAF